MKSAGLPGVCAAMLVFLAAGAGCTSAADNDAKPGKSERSTEPEGKIEMDSADNPQVGDPEPMVIPLEEIWAYRMPETRNVEKLGGKLVLDIRREVGFPSDDKNARPGFAVPGTGLEAALRSAHSVFTEKNEPCETFPQETSVSAVFFYYRSHFLRPPPPCGTPRQ